MNIEEMNMPVPVTLVLLKDGRTGTLRLSRTNIKHCKRNGLAVDVFIDGGEKEQIDARKIERFIS